MVSEQGPGRSLHADETPTEIMQAIQWEQNSLPPRLPEPSIWDRPPEIPVRNRERRQLKLTAALAVVIVAVLGVAAYEVASGMGGKPHVTAAPPATKVAAAPSSAQASVSPLPTPSLPSPSPSPSPSRSASPVAVVAQTLKPAGVTAVGPGGAAGDDPGTADLVLDGSTSTAWQTEWYATAEFGGLQTGTGLLIDMGSTATVTSVQVTLGPEAGADVEVRAGDSAAVSSLTTVATEAGQAGTVRFKLASPTRARYVLIWFTKLPPDGAGTYRVQVYNVSVTGQP